MEEAYRTIERTSSGRKILEGVPEKMEIGSSSWLEDNVNGQYIFGKQELELNSDKITSKEDEKIRVLIVMLHELRHASQINNGLLLEGQKLSVDQHLSVQKLIEAETQAWDIVNIATYEGPDQKNYGSRTKESIEAFKKRDIIGEARKSAKEKGILFNDAQFQAENMQLLRLQSCVRQAGTLEGGQKMRVGHLMKQLMDPETPEVGWQRGYDEQALSNTLHDCRRNDVSVRGNETAYNKALDYYMKEYGLKRQDVAKTGFSPYFQDIVNETKEVIRQAPDINAPGVQSRLEQLQDKVTQRAAGHGSNAQSHSLKNSLSRLSVQDPATVSVLPPERPSQAPQKEGVSPAVWAHLQGQKIA